MLDTVQRYWLEMSVNVGIRMAQMPPVSSIHDAALAASPLSKGEPATSDADWLSLGLQSNNRVRLPWQPGETTTCMVMGEGRGGGGRLHGYGAEHYARATAAWWIRVDSCRKVAMKNAHAWLCLLELPENMRHGAKKEVAQSLHGPLTIMLT